MTADEILRAGVEILGSEPEKGFRRLALQWHPDHCVDPRSGEVLAHLTKLRDRASGRQEEFTVQLPGAVARLGRDEIEVPEPARGFDALRARFEKPARLLERRGAKFVRPPDSVPLVEVLRRKGALPPHHVAWMASRLYELAWEADRAGQMVGGVYVEGLLVLVEAHGVVPMDLRFMARSGSKMEAVPAVLLPLVPKDKAATWRFDVACANKVALRLLGDPTGTGNALLTRAKNEPTLLPPRFLEWFRKAPEGSAEQSYRSYRDLLKEIFGPPKYHVLTV